MYVHYEGWLKSLSADQDNLKEYDQMRFIFQHSLPYCHTLWKKIINSRYKVLI